VADLQCECDEDVSASNCPKHRAEAQAWGIADPLEAFRAHIKFLGGTERTKAALTELERRARVERRLEAWIEKPSVGDDDEPRAARHTLMADGAHHIELWGTRRFGAYCGKGADRWTATDAALTAAGAPKESE
jgi:hypothetical protein